MSIAWKMALKFLWKQSPEITSSTLQRHLLELVTIVMAMGLVSWEDLKWLVHVTNRPLQPITQLHFADWSVQNTAIYVPITFEKWIQFIANYYNVTPAKERGFSAYLFIVVLLCCHFFWGSWFRLVVSLKNFISLIIPLLLFLIYLLPAYVFVSNLFITYLFIACLFIPPPNLMLPQRGEIFLVRLK